MMDISKEIAGLDSTLANTCCTNTVGQQLAIG